MNKEFWDGMALLWCKVFSSAALDKIAEMAKQHAKESQKKKAGYSVNPLDDDDEEDDF